MKTIREIREELRTLNTEHVLLLEELDRSLLLQQLCGADVFVGGQAAVNLTQIGRGKVWLIVTKADGTVMKWSLPPAFSCTGLSTMQYRTIHLRAIEYCVNKMQYDS